VNGALNAVVVKRYAEAREEARAADRRRAAGEPLGALHGVPVTVKECLDVAGTPTTFGVAARRGHLAEQDDPYVARLRAAGAVVLGKTNVAQMLAFIECDNPVYGRTNNPWDLARSPGGSSGGQAAIVAAGGVPLGLGTDIGGSSRVPAAFCGIVGIKPTAGRMPDIGRGSFPLGQRGIVSQVGVFARNVGDAALGLRVAATPLNEPTVPLGDYRQVDLSGLNVAVLNEDGAFEASAAYGRAVRQASEALLRRGARIVFIQPPPPAFAIAILYSLLSADGMAGMRRFLGRSKRDFRIKQLEQICTTPRKLRPFLQTLLRMTRRGKAAGLIPLFGPHSAAVHWDWVQRQMDYQAQWLAALDTTPHGRADLVLSPSCGLPALRHGASAEVGVAGAYSCLYNVLGWPAGVVPVTRVRPQEQTLTPRGRDMADRTATATEQGSAGLPIAVQVAARPWREDLVLAALAAIEADAVVQAEAPTLAALLAGPALGPARTAD
jgi:fatty acid amide hydrolase